MKQGIEDRAASRRVVREACRSVCGQQLRYCVSTIQTAKWAVLACRKLRMLHALHVQGNIHMGAAHSMTYLHELLLYILKILLSLLCLCQ